MQDECQSDPGGNPPDEAEAPSLHPQAAARKGGTLQGRLARSADGDFRPLDGLPPLRVAGASATFRPPLAFFPGYPVFLLGDLPPPTA